MTAEGKGKIVLCHIMWLWEPQLQVVLITTVCRECRIIWTKWEIKQRLACNTIFNITFEESALLQRPVASCRAGVVVLI